MAQSAGFSYAARWEQAVLRWPGLPARVTVIGGERVTCADAAAALAALESAGGIMVRQVLQAAGNPLSSCDYHAAAEPFLDAREEPGEWGRGAAGRPVTRLAFMAALEQALDQAAAAEPARHFAAELAEAFEAFSSDSGYAAAMARAAVQLREREHLASLKTRLAQAVHQAVSACDARAGEIGCAVAAACGTGACPFAPADLARITVPAGPGRMPRPANHVRAGSGFGAGPALAALEAAVPYAPAVTVRGADHATAEDSVAA